MTFRRLSDCAPPGVYIHVPFCRRKCAYCDFVTAPLSGLAPSYMGALRREILALAEPGAFLNGGGASPVYDSIYFGGGTPSIVHPDDIRRLLDAVRSALAVSDGAEVSLEANPEDVDAHRAAAWASAGVNRVTLGVQSAHDTTLSAMGRTHSAGDVLSAAANLRWAGFSNVGTDLILGLPGETSAMWMASLDAVCRVAPEHISLYMLDIHEGSAQARKAADGRWALPDEDALADFYLEAADALEARGWRQYETSNFALGGAANASRHNLKYWRMDPVVGLGLAAHSFDGRRRWRNDHRIREYVRLVEEGGSARVAEEPDRDIDREREFVFLGMRLVEGIRADTFAARFGHPFPEAWGRSLKNQVERGLCLEDNAAFRPTRLGLLLGDEIAQELFHED